MEFSVKDSFRTAIELASGGKNTVIYDNQGNPNIMVCIPKFDKSLLGLSAGTHGAFVLDENHEAGEIWVSKYTNGMGSGGVPVSMHGLFPDLEFCKFYKSKELIKSKGSGWHLMTNIEWAAIASLSVKQGTEPYGFTYSSPAFKKYLCTKHKPFGSDDTGWVNGKIAWNVMAGHSLNEFSHDGTADGIFDMVGNVWEQVDGMRVTRIGPDGTNFYGYGGKPQNRFRDERWTNGGRDWFIGHRYDAAGVRDTGLYIDCGDKVSTNGGTVLTCNEAKFENGADKYKEVVLELGIVPIQTPKYKATQFINTEYTADTENHDCVIARGGCAWSHNNSLVDYSIYSIDFVSPTEKAKRTHPIFPIRGVRACYISDLY